MSANQGPLIVQFGAGNIGRSLVGQLFARAGWRVLFVDAAPDIVTALQTRGRYLVRVKGERPAEITVDGVSALAADQLEAIADAVAEADLIGTAVGPAVLPKVFPAIAAGIVRRSRPISILLCENLHAAAELARQCLERHLPAGFGLEGRVGLVETSIGKMVPIMPAEVRRRDPLEVWAEDYNQILADRAGFIGEPPAVAGLVLHAHFVAYVERKLFIHNLGHAAAAYHGHLAKMTHIWEAVSDQRIRALAEAAMWESGRALIGKFPAEFTEANQREHIEDLLRRFGNRALGDTVYRVGRDLPRKLAPGDRCIGALRLARAQGIEPTAIRQTIAAALCFQATDEQGRPFEPDQALRRRVTQEGPAAVLSSHCGLDPLGEREEIEAISNFWQSLNRAGITS